MEALSRYYNYYGKCGVVGPTRVAEKIDWAVDGPAVLYSGLVRSVERCF